MPSVRTAAGCTSAKSAIRREVREEASIEVKDIRSCGSQTWPFPSNIMIGFRAEHASGELKPDGEEVVESGWFEPQMTRLSRTFALGHASRMSTANRPASNAAASAGPQPASRPFLVYYPLRNN